jgi:hypothetical protein
VPVEPPAASSRREGRSRLPHSREREEREREEEERGREEDEWEREGEGGRVSERGREREGEGERERERERVSQAPAWWAFVMTGAGVSLCGSCCRPSSTATGNTLVAIEEAYLGYVLYHDNPVTPMTLKLLQRIDARCTVTRAGTV